MILIISTVKDQSTSEVIEWIVYNNHPFVLIDELNKLVSITWSFEHGYQTTILKTMRGEEVDLKNVNAVWYRRGRFFIDYEVNSNCGLPPAPSDLDFDREFELSPESIDLFPNPAGSFITIEISDVNPLCGRIELMNQAGLLITELAQLDCTYRYGNVFQIDHYPAGIYYLQLRMAQGTVTKKFVISP